MRQELIIFAALTVLVIGGIAVWSNPWRGINRIFFTLSLQEAIWLLAMDKASGSAGPFWVRMVSAIGAFFPLHFWLVKETIVSGDLLRRTIVRARWWIAAALILAVLAFTDWFIPANSSKTHPLYGYGYYIYIAGSVALYLHLTREALTQLRTHTGIRRVELQSVFAAGSAAALAVCTLMALRAMLHSPWLTAMQPIVVLLFTAGTVVSITIHRIFDARQLLLMALQKLSLVGIFALIVVAVSNLLEYFIPHRIAVVITPIACLWFGIALNDWLNRRFHFYPQGTKAREAAFKAARSEARSEHLMKEFQAILLGWGQAEHMAMFSGPRTSLRGADESISVDVAVADALSRLRWATPERLDREKTDADRAILKSFLREHRLGIAVIAEGPALTLIVGVGAPITRQPFTYPQVTQLLELTAIFEGALERVHLSAKAQRAEQLATVGLLGAGFAHEIRNPLVSIKTFVQLLPRHYSDPAFRDKFFRLIGDEVGRIDRLTEQLLDLASPRVYAPAIVELHPILRSSLDLVAAKAVDKQVTIIPEFKADPNEVYTDPSAARQVLLNLCFNAIQAVEGRLGERWVIVSTQNVEGGVEMVVSDNGPGISAEIQSRLFEPFQTTRSTGFGLGLAICVDILASLNATLNVDPPTPGFGATFRVKFPCQPSSS